ncbi:MAG: leucine-rich repeat domain-containing protein, partial [Mycoplasmataceae bacterium]|nr:leucine-rich repeat domain-containing protein [Mycoplasmataceae bacterium]
GIIDISNGAFSDCFGLTSVAVPNTVTAIHSGAFSDCFGLTSLYLTDFTGSYGVNWLFNCTSLKNVYISENTTVTDENDDGWGRVGPEHGCKLFAPNETKANSFRSGVIEGEYCGPIEAAKWIFTHS